VSSIEARFLALPQGRRFCLVHRPQVLPVVARSMVYVHPFAEEMNKSRRMAALQARALAAAGWTVLQLDLFGCGDSEGEFGGATWNQWLDDTATGLEWLRAETGSMPALWGLRAGGLLAAQAMQGMDPVPDLLLWQPVISGQRYLQQFLRMNVAAQLSSAEGAARVGTQQLRDQLGRGEPVEVGGYEISPALALGMETSDLLPPSNPTRVAWLEVASGAALELSPASSQKVEAWRAAGHRVDIRVVEGLPFWQTQEIAECSALIEATLEAAEPWRQ
jgi:exosortase A-associated hydrolase 2